MDSILSGYLAARGVLGSGRDATLAIGMERSLGGSCLFCFSDMNVTQGKGVRVLYRSLARGNGRLCTNYLDLGLGWGSGRKYYCWLSTVSYCYRGTMNYGISTNQ
jgi:hypothetical protein